jgi:alpha/beta superfamily hydrolase
MVLAGQFLERPALIDAGGLVLEGLSHRGARRPGLLVCPPTGAGGGMDAPLVAELAWATARAGLPSLRFQHRGVGASQGAHDEGRALDDALAALEHLLATAPGPVVVAGVAGGAATALGLARARREVRGVALIDPSPPLATAGRARGAGRLEVRLLALLPERGAAPSEAALLRLARVGAGRVERIPGADPGFAARLPQVARALVAWLPTCR